MPGERHTFKGEEMELYEVSSDTEDVFDEPTVEMVDAHRMELMEEWHDIQESSSTLSALEVHQMHMLAMMFDLMYWTWKKTFPINFEQGPIGRVVV